MNHLDAEYRGEERSFLLDRYRILKTIADHGSRQTFLAVDTTTETEVILKVLHFNQAEDWKALELFERECQTLQELNHPQIPKYLNHFQVATEAERIEYLALEKVPGKPLSELKSEALPEEQVIQIARSALRVLGYLHALNPPVIHRDIKPDNLMLNSEGEVYLIDFGAIKSTLTSETTQVGSFDYMALEQMNGKATTRSDFYSLGVCLLVLLTQIAPSALPRSDLNFNLSAFEDISLGFRQWLLKMLAPMESQRFASAAEAISALDLLEQERSPQASLYQPERMHLSVQSEDQREIAIRVKTYIPVGFVLIELLKIIGKKCLPLAVILFLLGGTVALTVAMAIDMDNDLLPEQLMRFGVFPLTILAPLIWAYQEISRLFKQAASGYVLKLSPEGIFLKRKGFNFFPMGSKHYPYEELKRIALTEQGGMFFTTQEGKTQEYFFLSQEEDMHWLKKQLGLYTAVYDARDTISLDIT